MLECWSPGIRPNLEVSDSVWYSMCVWIFLFFHYNLMAVIHVDPTWLLLPKTLLLLFFLLWLGMLPFYTNSLLVLIHTLVHHSNFWVGICRWWQGRVEIHVYYHFTSMMQVNVSQPISICRWLQREISLNQRCKDQEMSCEYCKEINTIYTLRKGEKKDGKEDWRREKREEGRIEKVRNKNQAMVYFSNVHGCPFLKTRWNTTEE